MKSIYWLFALLLMLPLISLKKAKKFEPVAVVELFTSEGCSSCPPADELLSRTIQESQENGKRIYALAFHVDYWNRLGWKDSFSAKQFTERQQAYVSSMSLHSAYTPQMVVNGVKEFVGSNESSLKNSLNDALETNAAASFLSLKITSPNEGLIQVYYELQGDNQNCDIHFALVSLHETTAVKRGENGGRTLNHSNVVRQLVTRRADISGQIKFSDSPIPAKDNLAVIAFVQRKSDGQIIGCAEVKGL